MDDVDISAGIVGLLVVATVPACVVVVWATVRLLLHEDASTWRRYRRTALILAVVNVAIVAVSPRLWLLEMLRSFEHIGYYIDIKIVGIALPFANVVALAGYFMSRTLLHSPVSTRSD